MYCASSGHDCKITMARKQRPFYYASEEQFRWLQIIASRISPGTDLNDIGQLKEIAAGLEGMEVVKRELGVESPEDDDRPGRSESTPINIEQEEGMEGVVDGIGTLMLDPLGRESTLPQIGVGWINGRVYRGVRFRVISPQGERVRPISTPRRNPRNSLHPRPFPRTPRPIRTSRPSQRRRTNPRLHNNSRNPQHPRPLPPQHLLHRHHRPLCPPQSSPPPSPRRP